MAQRPTATYLAQCGNQSALAVIPVSLVVLTSNYHFAVFAFTQFIEGYLARKRTGISEHDWKRLQVWLNPDHLSPSGHWLEAVTVHILIFDFLRRPQTPRLLYRSHKATSSPSEELRLKANHYHQFPAERVFRCQWFVYSRSLIIFCLSM